MAVHKSIGERLRRAKSPEALQAVLTDWAADWERNQMDIVRQLEYGTSHMDEGVLASATGQLKAITQKQFTGLRNVLARLTSQDNGG